MIAVIFLIADHDVIFAHLLPCSKILPSLLPISCKIGKILQYLSRNLARCCQYLVRLAKSCNILAGILQDSCDFFFWKLLQESCANLARFIKNVIHILSSAMWCQTLEQSFKLSQDSWQSSSRFLQKSCPDFWAGDDM
jgi:hypothetical protein